VSAVASKNGQPTILGVSPGDKLVRVDQLETANARSGALFRALHGKPGETLVLVLERGGHRFSVPAKVTAF
jgi:C-terminal processing protease CtpA/Prc